MVSLNNACFGLAYQLSNSTSEIDTVSSKSCWFRCKKQGGGCKGLEGKCKNTCYCFGVSTVVLALTILFVFYDYIQV